MTCDAISIPSKLSMKESNIFNAYQTNILQHLLYMFKVKNSITRRIFHQVFLLIDHLYLARFVDNSLKIWYFNIELTRFGIGLRVSTIWNKFLTESEKYYTRIDVFKNKIQ